MTTEYFLFVHRTKCILAKLNTWCFQHSGDISCSLRVNPILTDESWEGGNTCLLIYTLNLLIEFCGEHWWQENIFRSFTRPQAFYQSSAPAVLSTLVSSVVLYLLIQATLIIPGNDETQVCAHTLWIYSMSTLENTDEYRMFFVHLPHHKHLEKVQHMMFWGLWRHQFFSTR